MIENGKGAICRKTTATIDPWNGHIIRTPNSDRVQVIYAVQITSGLSTKPKDVGAKDFLRLLILML